MEEEQPHPSRPWAWAWQLGLVLVPESGPHVLPPLAKPVLHTGPSRVQGDEIRSTCCSQQPPPGWTFFLRPPLPFLGALPPES